MPLSHRQPGSDFSVLPGAADEVFAICIDMIKALDDDAFHQKPPHWHHKTFESVAGNCIRVINHGNAHLRQVWMIRGALLDTKHWPVQTLVKIPDDERGRFHMPQRD